MAAPSAYRFEQRRVYALDDVATLVAPADYHAERARARRDHCQPLLIIVIL